MKNLLNSISHLSWSRRKVLSATLGLLSAGCIPVPVRVPTQVQGQSGVSADQRFIKLGQTSRDEVLRNLGWADVGMRETRLFWGRWIASTSRTDMIFLIPGALGSNQGDPNWSTHNLLVEFDENSTVSRSREIKEKDVVRELIAWSRHSASQPTKFSAFSQETFPASHDGFSKHHGSMMVRSDSLEFFDQRTRSTFKVANGDVESLKIKSDARVKPSFTLKFKKSTPWGSKIDVYIDPQYLLGLLSHLQLT